jgi:hypothetical protein
LSPNDENKKQLTRRIKYSSQDRPRKQATRKQASISLSNTHTFSSMNLFITCCLLGLGSMTVLAAEEVLWFAPDRLERNHAIMAQNGGCRLRMNGDGNVVVHRRLKALDDKPDRWAVSWNLGSFAKEGKYVLELTVDGQLVVYDEEEPNFPTVWQSDNNHTAPGDSGAEYTLVMDSACRLKVQKDRVDIWANIKIPPFSAGQVLQKGDMFRMTRDHNSLSTIPHPFTLHYTLVLQHDCNLVQFIGTDLADRSETVWAANAMYPGSGGGDCHMYLDPKGRVSLHEGSFNHTISRDEIRPYEYWSTPPGWMEQDGYGDEMLLETYELVLSTDGSIFDWRCCNQLPLLSP